jgi:hypothetical protein
LNRFRFGFSFFKKKFSLVIFLIKTEPNRKSSSLFLTVVAVVLFFIINMGI